MPHSLKEITDHTVEYCLYKTLSLKDFPTVNLDLVLVIKMWLPSNRSTLSILTLSIF